tara:strand:+ start:165 stop:479 length:315 start_codon:yes stop_codon:yes gene_type:complete
MAFKLKGPTLYKNKYGNDGLVKKENKELDLSDREDTYVTKALETKAKVDATLRGDSVDSVMAMKSSPLDKYASAAQRRAIWANKADGGAGHPDNKKKKKKRKKK